MRQVGELMDETDLCGSTVRGANIDAYIPGMHLCSAELPEAVGVTAHHHTPVATVHLHAHRITTLHSIV